MEFSPSRFNNDYIFQWLERMRGGELRKRQDQGQRKKTGKNTMALMKQTNQDGPVSADCQGLVKTQKSFK